MSQKKTNNISLFFAVASSLLGLFSTPLPASAQGIVNGSFESGNFVDNSGLRVMSLQPGNTSITGWNVISAEMAWVDGPTAFNIPASEGNRSLDLAGFHDSFPFGGVSQSISTEVGGNYRLSFDIGANGVFNSSMSVAVSAGSARQIFTVNNIPRQMTWQSFDYDFTASNPSTLISFVGNSGPIHIGLDDVSIRCTNCPVVPEPTSILGTGLVLAFFPKLKKIAQKG
jgi:hypothetical protein